MVNKDIINETYNCVVEGIINSYKGYILKHSDLKRHKYNIETPFICIIATTVIFNINPNLDYLYINRMSSLSELLSIDVSIIQNPSVIFIPITNNSDVDTIVEDIKQKHPNHGFNEEPFNNSL